MAEWIVEIVDGVPHIRKMTELVRCKDCVHARLDDEDGWICQAHERPTKDNDYCSYGKKVTE